MIKKSPGVWFMLILAAACVVLMGVVAIFSSRVSRDVSVVRVSIPIGASARGIADILAEEHLIRSRLVFLLTCRATGSSDKLKPGIYGLSPSMNTPKIVRLLVEGKSQESWVTIPEGFTARQIGDALEKKELVQSNAFVRVAITRGFEFPQFSFKGNHSLEGYLFPDTYLVKRGDDPGAIIEMMLMTFQKKVVDTLEPQVERVGRERFALGRGDFPEALRRIVILASLVEREAREPADRPAIAAVLWNRLKGNMKLEICATVSYVPGESRENKPRVSVADTRTESPYNTYIHRGLPPGPICNPGVASIKAVLEPDRSGYLYYLARKDGSHVFSRTFKEHLAAKRSLEKE